jgi:hypothetical protein
MKTASSILALALGLTIPAFCADTKDAGVPQYNAKTEITFEGTISKVRLVPEGEAYAGVHITLQSYDVFLGPESFLKFLSVNLREGQKFTGVIGSVVKVNGADLVLARELRLDKTFISLRDEKGFPNWLWMATQVHTGGGL